MNDLTRDQQKLAHAVAGLRHLANPDGTKPEWGGGSLRLSTTVGEIRWHEYDTRSIRGMSDLSGRTLVTITWAQLGAYGQTLSPGLLEAVRDHGRRSTEHALASRSYPNRHANPEGWVEVHQWHREVHHPEYLALAAEGKELRDRCYPLAVTTEPVDLFDLLDAT